MRATGGVARLNFKRYLDPQISNACLFVSTCYPTGQSEIEDICLYRVMFICNKEETFMDWKGVVTNNECCYSEEQEGASTDSRGRSYQVTFGVTSFLIFN